MTAFRSFNLAAAGMLLFVCSAMAADPVWPQWRGPEGNGLSAEKDLPVKWDASSIVWKTPLKGGGQSSPVIWGERLFFTEFLEAGKKRLVVAADCKSGKILWEMEVWNGTPELSHQQNGWASATCAADGQHVVAFFGKGGLHCFSVEGKLLWSRDLGQFPGQWGTGASPIIYGDLVIQNCEAQGDSYLLAVNKTTGKDVWKTPRSTPEKGGWSSPVIVPNGNTKELVLNGEKAVVGYDPATGKQLWSCKSFNGRGEPTVAYGKGLIYVVNGLAGDIYSVKPGGRGDVTKTHMAWHTPRKSGRDQPSPILVGDYVLVASMSGILTCYEGATGKVIYTGERLKGEYCSAPIATDGKVYFQSLAGETTVIEPGPKPNVVATNTLGASGETFRASLSPCKGQMFTRSDKNLYCIGQKK